MRDVTENVTSVNYTIDDWYDPGWPKEPAPGHASQVFSHRSLLRGRSDIRQGDGVRPLPYRAYEIRVRPKVFKLNTEDPPKRITYYDNGYKRVWVIKKYASTGMLPIPNSGFIYMNVNYLEWKPLVPSKIIGRAINKALGKLSDSDLNLGQSLGEIRETGNMMKHRLAKLLRAFRNLLKGNFRAMARELGLRNRTRRGDRSAKYLSEIWLEYQLGWKPLMNDIFNGYNAIKDSLDDSLIRVTAVETDRFGQVLPEYSFEGANVLGCQIGLTASVDDISKARLNRLGLSDPLGIAWELTPLSFVMDWFLSVGDFISGLRANQGLKYEYGYQTTFVKCNGILRKTDSFSPVPGKVWEGTQPSWDCKVFAMERIQLPLLPLPTIVLNKGLSSVTKASIASALVLVRTIK